MKTIVMCAVLVATCVAGQAQKKYDYGTDSVACVQNLSLFNEFIKQKAYEEALKPWRECTTICPKSRKGLYVSGAKMFKALIKKEEDATKKDALVTDLMGLYDLRVASFGQEGYVTGRKGVDHYRLRPDATCDAKDIMKKSVDLRKNKSEAVVISTYYQALYKCYREEKVELEELFTEYLSLSDIINHNIETLEDSTKAAKYVSAKNNLDEFFVKFAKCEDISRIFKERIDAAPSDLELKKKALRIMSRKECDDEPLFKEVAIAVHDAEPSHESAYALARMFAKEKDISGALNYYEQAVSLCGGCAELENYLEKAALFASVAGEHGKAVGYANQLLKVNPSNGYAYIVKGNRMMTSSGRCDDGKAGKYGAYWMAAGIYQKAINVDSRDKVKDFARKQLGAARARFPTKQVIFQMGLSEGSSYSLPCEGGASVTIQIQ